MHVYDHRTKPYMYSSTLLVTDYHQTAPILLFYITQNNCLNKRYIIF